MEEFEQLINEEADMIARGKSEGVTSGRIQGLQEGRQIGIYKGFEISQEVGFYRGALRVIQAALARPAEPAGGGGDGGEGTSGESSESAGGVGGKHSGRAARLAQQVDSMLNSFPHGDPLDESLTDKLDELRSKFKVLAAVLGLQQELTAGLRQSFATGNETTPEGKLSGMEF